MSAPKNSYHHGNLRAALLEAGEALLAETGVERFSLRQVAKRVGVNHSAPAHHFGDVQGLLTALAAEGFRRLTRAMQARQTRTGDDPIELLYASMQGYLDFAQESPALFQLTFGSRKPAERTPEFAEAADDAYMHLAADIGRIRGASPINDRAGQADMVVAWSLVHGFAQLVTFDRLRPLHGASRQEIEDFFRLMFERTIRAGDRNGSGRPQAGEPADR